jgi:hypothetical protein
MTRRPGNRNRWPQFRISGLLGLMAIVAVVSWLIGAGALFGLIWFVIWFFPTVVGVLLGLCTWRTGSQAGGVLTGIVWGVAGLGLVASVLSLGVGIIFWLPLMLAWMPQYALALTYFDTSSAPVNSFDEDLPENWAAELAARVDESDDESPQGALSRLQLVPERERPSSIVNFGWRVRKG